MQLPEAAVGHTTRLSVHVLPLSPLWMPTSLVLCPSRLTVMPQQPLQDDQEELTAEVVGWHEGIERRGEGMILQKRALYRRK